MTVAESLKREKREFLNDDYMIDRFNKYQRVRNNERSINVDNIDTSKLTMSFDDTLYRDQWYLVSYLIIIMMINKQ